MHNLSDEALWLENFGYQFFCGELSFCHKLPFDRSSLTRWRQRLGEEQLVALIQESLSVAHKTGAIETRDLERVVMDTTVQPKAIAPDARFMPSDLGALQLAADLATKVSIQVPSASADPSSAAASAFMVSPQRVFDDGRI